MVIWPDSTGLRPGELAPQFVLHDLKKQTWDSRTLLGKSSLLLVIPHGLPIPSTIPALQKSSEEEQSKVRWVIVRETATATRDWAVSLMDKEGQFAKSVAFPSVISIDRAGWIRSIEPLPSIETNDPTWNSLLDFNDPTPPLSVGQVAPDFSFKDAFGFWHSVSALRGKQNLLLTFFPKCFTGGCQNHLSSLRDCFPQLIEMKTQVWAVSVDPAEGEHGQRAFSSALKLPFPVLPDVGRNICLLYEATHNTEQLALRQTVFIDKNGIVRWIDRAIDVNTHGKDVVTRIQKLQTVP